MDLASIVARAWSSCTGGKWARKRESAVKAKMVAGACAAAGGAKAESTTAIKDMVANKGNRSFSDSHNNTPMGANGAKHPRKSELAHT